MRTPRTRSGAVRLLHIVHGLDVGGLEVGLANLIERTREQFAHSVCCLTRRGVIAERLERDGVPVHFLGKREGHEWGLFLRIARVCRAVQPDIVHTQSWGAFDGVPGARLARVPVLIHSEHGWDSETETRMFRRNRTRRLLAPFIDRLVVVSEDVRRRIERDLGLRSDKVALVPNGVDTEHFKPLADRQQRRGELGYGEGELLIGTVGRAVAVKNWAALLDVFAGLLPHHRNLRLVLVGDGPEKTALEARARDLGLGGAVRFAGPREDVRSWLGSMDVFVMPSSNEATSLALLEAMATELPVIATMVGGNPEVVADGTTGRIIPAGDRQALAEAILFYCNDDGARGEHGRAGRARVAQLYSIDAMVAGYANVYRQALTRRCPALA